MLSVILLPRSPEAYTSEASAAGRILLNKLPCVAEDVLEIIIVVVMMIVVIL